VRVTAEVTPHHLALTEESVLGYNTSAKVNPPLRTREDVDALREALADGTIDCIATDHAPHHYDEKEREFNYAPFGLIGFETSLAVGITFLVNGGILSLSHLIESMSTKPARIAGIPGGTLAPGSIADIAVFDPNHQWVVGETPSYSKSHNTPFSGMTLTGKNVMTLLGGVVVWEAELFTSRRREQPTGRRKKALTKRA
jgi:dihydroorotase